VEQHEADYIQRDFFGLLPGAAGGRALRALKGSDYFAELARKSVAKHPEGHMRELGKRGAVERRRRLYHTPRMVRYIELDELVTERIVPWWPHQKNRQRRKRPVFVRIELERILLDETK
jgi:hypothetical protein